MSFALAGARVFDGAALRDGLAVVIDGERIVAVIPETDCAGIETRHLGGGLLAPGFIDVQVNGGGGALLNDDPSADTVRRIAQAHRRHGVTGLLPTVITDAQAVIAGAIVAVRLAKHAPGILGIHVEGPFLDPVRKGAHAARFIRAMTERDIDTLAAHDCGTLMLTLAPNRVPPAFIRTLTNAGIRVSLGHSDATAAEALAALGAGATAFTHLFNAMSQMTGREPGMVGAAFASRASFCGLIADGFHVEDTAMKAAIAAKGADRIMLISDAMPSAADGPDEFLLQGRVVRRVAGRLTLEDGTLAGSDTTMDAALRHCVNRLGVPLEAALTMASATPAAFLGRSHDLGRVAPGCLASLVHLGDDLSVRSTWINGQ
jgi:N-acetylglucosamine-6-phosphate deacetylase